ncbi:MAG: FAD:protein FMN transferase [Lachnospiraceae bacterium]|nr:FAD:protein FMN transferase [Lachnospiraceae bacterium]
MNNIGKKFISMVVGLAVLAAILILVYRAEYATEEAHTKDMFAMDTYFVLKAYGPEAETALELCEAKVLELEAALSVTKADSDVSKYNNRESRMVSWDTYTLVEKALQLCEETDGALDITLYPVQQAWGFTTDSKRVPSHEELKELLKKVDYKGLIPSAPGRCPIIGMGEQQIDLGAVAKGYTGDCLLDILREQGVTSAMLDLGGNVQVLGSKPDGSPWKVAVRNPLDTSTAIGVLEISDKAVITSGSYERYFEENGKRYWHILDPKTGYPADKGLVSVTVVGESGVRCDGLSTALFVMGKKNAVEFWRSAGDFEMLLVTEGGELYITEGLQENFVCSEGWNAEVINR